MDQRRRHGGRANRPVFWCVLLAVLLVLVGCGGSDDPASGPVTTADRSGPGTTGSKGSGGDATVFKLAEVTVEAPADWSVDEPVTYDLPGVGAVSGSVVSIDPTAWGTTWAVPGVFVAVRPELAEEIGVAGGGTRAILALADWHGGLTQPACGRSGASLYESADGQLSGYTTLWTDCGGVGVTLLDMAAAPDDGSFVLIGLATVTDDFERSDLEAVLDSIVVTGT